MGNSLKRPQFGITREAGTACHKRALKLKKPWYQITLVQRALIRA